MVWHGIQHVAWRDVLPVGGMKTGWFKKSNIS